MTCTFANFIPVAIFLYPIKKVFQIKKYEHEYEPRAHLGLRPGQGIWVLRKGILKSFWTYFRHFRGKWPFQGHFSFWEQEMYIPPPLYASLGTQNIVMTIYYSVSINWLSFYSAPTNVMSKFSHAEKEWTCSTSKTKTRMFRWQECLSYCVSVNRQLKHFYHDSQNSVCGCCKDPLVATERARMPQSREIKWWCIKESKGCWNTRTRF